MSIIKKINEELTEIFNNIGYEVEQVNLQPSGRKDLGDYQINDAMTLAKKYHQNPREIAEKIKDFFPSTTVEALAESVQSYKDIDAWNETPVLKKEAFDRLQEVMKSAGELSQNAPYDKIVNNKYAENIKK